MGHTSEEGAGRVGACLLLLHTESKKGRCNTKKYMTSQEKRGGGKQASKMTNQSQRRDPSEMEWDGPCTYVAVRRHTRM